MRRLSSRTTWWTKRAFPTCWFGFVVVWATVITGPILQGQVPVFVLLIPVAMAVVGYVVMRLLIFDVVDELLLDADDLVVRNAGDEVRVPLATLVHVQASSFTNPERITLTFKPPCRLGHEIVFLPPMRFFAFGRHPLADELTRRIQKLGTASPY
jgi:hypothetical protein